MDTTTAGIILAFGLGKDKSVACICTGAPAAASPLL